MIQKRFLYWAICLIFGTNTSKQFPKGFVRVLGKLAEWTDDGIHVYFFTGNHDMWMLDYLEKELNIKIFFAPETPLYK